MPAAIVPPVSRDSKKGTAIADAPDVRESKESTPMADAQHENDDSNTALEEADGQDVDVPADDEMDIHAEEGPSSNDVDMHFVGSVEAAQSLGSL